MDLIRIRVARARPCEGKGVTRGGAGMNRCGACDHATPPSAIFGPSLITSARKNKWLAANCVSNYSDPYVRRERHKFTLSTVFICFSTWAKTSATPNRVFRAREGGVRCYIYGRILIACRTRQERVVRNERFDRIDNLAFALMGLIK